ncbi:MAG: hypothetical protein GX565_14980 [Lentisphaerae bacterium]|nr:hypothetical protein [Lentisphaerota bacterium]
MGMVELYGLSKVEIELIQRRLNQLTALLRDDVATAFITFHNSIMRDGKAQCSIRLENENRHRASVTYDIGRDKSITIDMESDGFKLYYSNNETKPCPIPHTAPARMQSYRIYMYLTTGTLKEASLCANPSVSLVDSKKVNSAPNTQSKPNALSESVAQACSTKLLKDHPVSKRKFNDMNKLLNIIKTLQDFSGGA